MVPGTGSGSKTLLCSIEDIQAGGQHIHTYTHICSIIKISHRWSMYILYAYLVVWVPLHWENVKHRIKYYNLIKRFVKWAARKLKTIAHWTIEEAVSLSRDFLNFSFLNRTHVGTVGTGYRRYQMVPVPNGFANNFVVTEIFTRLTYTARSQL